MTPVLDRTSLEQFRTIVARRLGLQYEDEKLDYLAEVARRGLLSRNPTSTLAGFRSQPRSPLGNSCLINGRNCT